MKKLITTATALALVLALLPARPARAVDCTNLSSLAAECIQARTCQLLTGVGARTFGLLANIGTQTLLTLTRLNAVPAPLKYCQGGGRTNLFCKSNGHATLGCPGGGECSPRATVNLGISTVETGRNTLLTTIGAGCLGKCTAGFVKLLGKPCAVNDDCGTAGNCLLVGSKPVNPNVLGFQNVPCEPVLTAAPVSPSAWLTQYRNVAKCVTKTAIGDYKTGNVEDAIMRLISTSTGQQGTGTLPQNKKGSPPRAIAQMQASTLLQIGSAALAASTAIAEYGTMQYYSLAHCVNKLGNAYASGPVACLNNIDCGATVACTVNADCGTGVYCGTGLCKIGLAVASPVCVGNTPVGSDIPGTAIGTDLNTLSTQSTCSSGLAFCLHTVTTGTSNGTAAAITIDLTTGAFSSRAPIATNLYKTAGGAACATFDGCPICNGGHCRGECVTNPAGAAVGTKCYSNADCGANICTVFNPKTCDTTNGSPSIECLPDVSFIPATIIPNPFILNTTAGTMNIAPGQTTKFCGKCTGSLNAHTIGCQTDADCTAAGEVSCDFSSSGAGFGKGGSAVTSISRPGRNGQYTATTSGIFCTGTTGGALDTLLGLPGPVRFVSQVVQTYSYGLN